MTSTIQEIPMKPFEFIGAKPAAAIALALCAASLSACGGGGHLFNGAGTSNPPVPGPVPDAFVAAVSGVIAASSDMTEASDTDAVMSTAPETTEPEPLG
jgi:hypothetical protein